MADRLPHDLERLGDELASAAGRSVAARRRRAELRRRLAGAGVAGALVFAALTPATLGPAQREPQPIGPVAVQDAQRLGCDQPRGARFTLPDCQ